MKQHIDSLVAGYERDIFQINQKLNAIEIAKVELQTNLQRLQGAVAAMGELQRAAAQAEAEEKSPEEPVEARESDAREEDRFDTESKLELVKSAE